MNISRDRKHLQRLHERVKGSQRAEHEKGSEEDAEKYNSFDLRQVVSGIFILFDHLANPDGSLSLQN
jgi:hypothetical protein